MRRAALHLKLHNISTDLTIFSCKVADNLEARAVITGHIKVPLELPDIGSKSAGLMTQNPTLGNDLQWR